MTTKARRIPLDPDPVAGGNVRLTGDQAEVLSGEALEAAKARLEPLYMPHHATCPEGKNWKRRSGSKQRRTIERRDG